MMNVCTNEAFASLGSLITGPRLLETAGSTAKSMLPTIRSGYETAEVDALGMMRKENPLLDEDWGRSKMEVFSEAQKIRAEEDRKARLLQLLGGYEKESALRNELRSQTRLREKAVEKLLSTVA